jgi:hypothetical protein
MEQSKKWRIEFETGDTLVTEDEALASLHREKGRIVVPLPTPTPENPSKCGIR